jgi:hypothetical protein
VSTPIDTHFLAIVFNFHRAAFYEREVILIRSQFRYSTSTVGWLSMKQCIARGITIELAYKSSLYLFRCLGSPKGDPIAPVIATATLINSSTKLEDISRFLREVNTALQGVNTSKAAELLRPLRTESVFPITTRPKMRGYDKLSSMVDGN